MIGRAWRLATVAAAIAGAVLAGSAPGAAAADGCAAGTPSLAAVDCAGIVPVPSLDPAATDQAWRALVLKAQSSPAPLAAPDCRPLRAVFYTPTDWLRLATTLAASGSPCAQTF